MVGWAAGLADAREEGKNGGWAAPLFKDRTKRNKGELSLSVAWLVYSWWTYAPASTDGSRHWAMNTVVIWADPGVLWKKAPRAMRAMRGKTLETVPFQPYFGCTKSFLKVLSN